MTDREIIYKIYNIIATNTNFNNRTKAEKEIIKLVNTEIFIKER